MSGAVEVKPSSRRGSFTPPRLTKVVVRKVGPWSVLRSSLIFYFCVMLIGWFALLILYWILGSIGVLTSLGNGIAKALPVGHCPSGQTVGCAFTFNGTWIFSRMFLLGLVLVVLWSFLNMLVALVYNLVSDVVGGVEITLVERR